jgi:hypothetical protein
MFWEDFSTLLQKEVESKSNLRNIHISFALDEIDFCAPLKSDVKVLILLEPPAVMPENYQKRKWNNFDFVFMLSPWRAERFGLPLIGFQPVQRPSFERRDFESKKPAIVFINDFKFGAVKSSLYGWRLRCLSLLEKEGVPIDVFGPNWTMSKFMEVRKRLAATKRALMHPNFSLREGWSSLFFRPKRYFGSVKSKNETLETYSFCLVIENDEYSLTEKLFDAIFSGARVFYRGPSLDHHVPLGNLCIQLPKDVRAAVKIMKTSLMDDFSVLDAEGAAFVNDKTSMNFCSVEKLARDIADFLEIAIQRGQISILQIELKRDE